MVKRFMKLSVLPLVALIISTGFSSTKMEGRNSSSIFISDVVGEQAYVPYSYEVNLNPQQNIPFVGKSYYGFCEDVGFSESSNNYRAVNRLGYVGKYQFGWSALKWVGVRSKRQFLNTPLLQESAFEALISRNKYVMRDYIETYVGQTIQGVKITESGLIAAAHLGGAGNVMKFLCSDGQEVFADANNVPITKYMMKFADYDLTSVLTNRNAIATL